jgi:hypothetical protein
MLAEDNSNIVSNSCIQFVWDEIPWGGATIGSIAGPGKYGAFLSGNKVDPYARAMSSECLGAIGW